jgi:hypothetical protein
VTAEALLARIESDGFDRAVFLTALAAFEADDNEENERSMADAHPANWMSAEEIAGPIQDAVLHLLFGDE